MKIFYKNAFRRFVKKQNRPFQLAIEDEVDGILKEPATGDFKKGDLSEFRVHKFKFKAREYLVAYKYLGKSIIFYMIGPHENFYRELKRYTREAG